MPSPFIHSQMLCSQAADAANLPFENVFLSTMDGALIADHEMVWSGTQVIVQRHFSPHLVPCDEEDEDTVVQRCGGGHRRSSAGAEEYKDPSSPFFSNLSLEIASFPCSAAAAEFSCQQHEEVKAVSFVSSVADLVLPSELAAEDGGIEPEWLCCERGAYSTSCSELAWLDQPCGQQRTIITPTWGQGETLRVRIDEDEEGEEVKEEREVKEETGEIETCWGAEAALVTVAVKALSGQRHQLAFGADELVVEVKAAVGEREGLTHDRVALLFKSRKLADFETLRDSGIADGATLCMVPLCL